MLKLKLAYPPPLFVIIAAVYDIPVAAGTAPVPAIVDTPVAAVDIGSVKETTATLIDVVAVKVNVPETVTVLPTLIY